MFVFYIEIISKISFEQKTTPQAISKNGKMDDFTVCYFNKTNDFKTTRIQSCVKEKKKFIPYFLAASVVENIIMKKDTKLLQ